MRRAKILKLTSILAMAGIAVGLTLFNCGEDGSNAPIVTSNDAGNDSGGNNVDGGRDASAETPEAKLKAVVTAQWTKFANGVTVGGLTTNVITPKGEYFASTLPNATADSHYRAASTTKTFTAASIMLLHQRGKLDIAHKIEAMIPGTTTPYVPATADYAIPHKSEITIRQLLDHRAGVFDVGNTNIPADAGAPYAGQRYGDWVEETKGATHTFTIDELVGVVASNNLVGHLPEARFHYSNTGYSLLAKIVEQVSGKKFSQFVHDEFVVPNGLDQTTFPDDGTVQDLPAPFLEGTTRVGGQLIPTTSRNVSWGVGEGNVVTTPRNLTRWIRRLMKGEAGVDATRTAMMRECKPTDEEHVAYGLGIECHPSELGAGHNGAITGYLTSTRHDPKTDVTVIVFATLLDADNFMAEGEMLYDTALKVRAELGY